jgi:hypothetical protein
MLYGAFTPDKPFSIVFSYPVGDELRAIRASDLSSEQAIADDIFNGMRGHQPPPSQPIGPTTRKFVQDALHIMFNQWKSQTERHV